MSGHTQGGLSLGEFSTSSADLLNRYGQSIAIVTSPSKPQTGEAHANARRLVACWNAFDGIPTEKFEGKSVEEFVTTEAYLTGMQPSPHKGGFEIGLTVLAGQLLAASFAGQFAGTGATNFLEINMGHPAIGPFSVTMQKTSGLTPAAMKAQAEKERDEAIGLLRAVFFTHNTHIQALNNAGANPIESPEWSAIRQLLKDK